MKKLILLCSILICSMFSFAQTLVPSTISSVCSGSTITLTGSGESYTGHYYIGGNYENIVPTSSGVTKSVISETFFNHTTGAPTKYVIQLNLPAGATSAVTITLNMQMFLGQNGSTTGLSPVVPITVTIYPSTASQCIVPPPSTTVTFKINEPNNTTGTSFELSDGYININSGYTIKNSPSTIYASFAPYSPTNPYTQIPASSTSTIIVYATAGYSPVSATLTVGSTNINGVIVPATFSNPESITFSNVNITTAPLTVTINLY